MSLLRDGWCDEGAERVDDHQEADDDERRADPREMRNRSSRSTSRGHGDAEQRTEEHDDHDLVREPEQLEDDVERGDDRGGAQDVGAAPARTGAGGGAGTPACSWSVTAGSVTA